MKRSELTPDPALAAGPVPVICDHCREEGEAGFAPFAEVRDILHFTPVKRRLHADGWRPEVQRAFIAALAITGSPRRAGRAIGKHTNGAEQLRKAPTGKSFSEAWDAALDLYRDREMHRLQASLAQLSEEQALLHDTSPPPACGRGQGEGLSDMGEGDSGNSDSIDLGDGMTMPRLMHELFGKYCLKLQAERDARLEGRIAEADFLVRQLTYFEVALDLAHDDGLYAALEGLRKDGTHHTQIAETPASRFLGYIRREAWEADAEEPQRPPPPAEHLLVDNATYKTEPLPCYGPFAHPAEGYEIEQWEQLGDADRKAIYREQFRRAAEAQLAWERQAIAEWQARHPNPSPFAGEGDSPSGERGEGANQ